MQPWNTALEGTVGMWESTCVCIGWLGFPGLGVLEVLGV